MRGKSLTYRQQVFLEVSDLEFPVIDRNVSEFVFGKSETYRASEVKDRVAIVIRVVCEARPYRFQF
jgi:hypothetical protein